MLYEDEDDFFMGSPKSKFFDILFNANRELVKTKLLEIVDRYSAMEILLEKQVGVDALEGMIRTVLTEDWILLLSIIMIFLLVLLGKY